MIRMLSCSLFRVPPLLAGSLVSIHDMSFSLGLHIITIGMMKVKANYKGATNDLKCRWCQNNLETQKHILTACPYFTKITNKTPYETYFMNERTATSKTAKILHKIHPIVEAKPYNFLTNTTDDTETSNT